jgi:uncharacterized protein YdbL (DUF1318 family)
MESFYQNPNPLDPPPYMYLLQSGEDIPSTEKGVANGVATLGSDSKVPAVQSRASTVTYDDLTGTFTFTWADNSSQSVTVSLATSGDLPEIQTATQAPVSAPSAGQKLYIRTDTEQYWTAVSGVWVGPSILFTQAERNKLGTIAAGATANSTDSQLRDRVTHTGAQATSTITGLDTALANSATHLANTSNPHSTTAAQVGAIPTTEKAAASGVASLGSDSKVPATQSRASNVTYDAPTGTFTFTWADGSTQSVNTPVELLFQSVNYNSSTQDLTFTLNSGATATVSLANLVDLPEIQMAAQAPVANPTTGQKLYIRTDTGEYWSAVSGAWAGPNIPFTQAERTKLGNIESGATNSSAHIASTSNPHAVTAAQIGNTTAQWNASQIQGVAIPEPSGINTVPVFNAGAITWGAQNAPTGATITASKTFALADAGVYQHCNNTSAINLTIPLNSSVAFPQWAEIDVSRNNTGAVSIDVASGVTLRDGATTLTTPYSLLRGCTLKQVATNQWQLMGG